MKIYDTHRHWGQIPVFAETIEEAVKEINEYRDATIEDVLEVPLPPGVFLGQWHKVSEWMPELNKQVWIKLPDVDDWYETQYLPGCIITLFNEPRWSIFGEQNRSIENTEWMEIPE